MRMQARVSAPWTCPPNAQSMPGRLFHLLSSGDHMDLLFDSPFPDDFYLILPSQAPLSRWSPTWLLSSSATPDSITAPPEDIVTCWALFLWCAEAFGVSKLCSVAKWTCEMLVFNILWKFHWNNYFRLSLQYASTPQLTPSPWQTHLHIHKNEDTASGEPGDQGRYQTLSPKPMHSHD